MISDTVRHFLILEILESESMEAAEGALQRVLKFEACSSCGGSGRKDKQQDGPIYDYCGSIGKLLQCPICDSEQTFAEMVDDFEKDLATCTKCLTACNKKIIGWFAIEEAESKARQLEHVEIYRENFVKNEIVILHEEGIENRWYPNFTKVKHE